MAPPLLARTGWWLDTIAGFDMLVGAGLASLRIYVHHDSDPSVQHCLSFSGLGAGFSDIGDATLPIGFDVGFKNLPSTGYDILIGSSSAALYPPFAVDEFVRPATIVTLGASAGYGYNWSIVFWTSWMIPVYIGKVSGAVAGLPGAAFSVFSGGVTSIEY